MSLYLDDISFQSALDSIREVSLDLNPVQCFSITTEQDFSFVKTDGGFTINEQEYSFGDIPKLYHLMNKLNDINGVTALPTPEYVPTDYCTNLINVTINLTKDSDPKSVTLKRKNFFSQSVIEEIMSNFFGSNLPYDGVPKTVSEIFDYLTYFDKQRMILWVAYYLIDRRRMMMASAGELMRINGMGDSCGDFVNKNNTVTTSVGDVFSVTESIDETGKGLDGFTSLWGDKYSYLTKYQLWIRDRLEKQFKDYSLRDDVMINQSFSMVKGWEGDAWINTLRLSEFTEDLMLPDNRTTR